jgi:hypothetical protein
MRLLPLLVSRAMRIFHLAALGASSTSLSVLRLFTNVICQDLTPWTCLEELRQRHLPLISGNSP